MRRQTYLAKHSHAVEETQQVEIRDSIQFLRAKLLGNISGILSFRHCFSIFHREPTVLE